MIKFNAGWIVDREAYLVGLGLSEGNLRILMDDNRPIAIKSESLNLPDPGLDLVIFAGADEEQIKERAGIMLEKHIADPDSKVPAIRVQDLFYLFPFFRPAVSRPLYLLGLDGKTYEHFRQKKYFSFRLRVKEGQGVSVEVLVFSGDSERAMEQAFRDSGLIGPKTKIKLTGNPSLVAHFWREERE